MYDVCHEKEDEKGVYAHTHERMPRVGLQTHCHEEEDGDEHIDSDALEWVLHWILLLPNEIGQEH